MLGKLMAAAVAVALFGWLGAGPVQARGGGGGHGGGHGGGGHYGGGHYGGGHYGGYGGYRGYGYGGYGRGYGYGYGRGFGYGGFYPGFGLGYGLGLGLGYGGYGYGGYGGGGYGYGGYGYGGYGYGGYGYGGYPYGGGYGYGDPYAGYGYGAAGYGGYPYGGVYGGYASPYSAGYNYPPMQNNYSPGYLQMPADPNATYPYNGDPSVVPPLLGPTPRQAPEAPPQSTLPMKTQLVSQPGQLAPYRFVAYGEAPQTEQTVRQAVPARQTLRVVYPAYGETEPAVTLTTQLR